jgi:PEP-CTERM motif
MRAHRNQARVTQAQEPIGGEMINRSRSIGKALTALLLVIWASQAQAVPLVTYSWTTTSQGFGLHVSQPSSATFQVPLSDVQNGFIPQFDITNIQFIYPGLTFNDTAASSIGIDFSAFVDPLTGAFVFHDVGQGLAGIAFAGTDINSTTTFLSITIDNPVSGHVADEFNALSSGSPFAGYPTAGFWTASFPATSTPEPSTLTLLGFGLAGVAMARRRKKFVS